MTHENSPLPYFDSPPVVETVLGVQFNPIPEWTVVEFGLLWERFREEFAEYEVQPPIARSDEPPFQLLFAAPDVRCWFKHVSGQRLIQVQRDRFLHNWRKASETDSYPRYETIRPHFEAAWEKYLEFLDSVEIKRPVVTECEVTYVNHIDDEHGWESFANLTKVIAGWRGTGSSGFLPPPNAVNLVASYPISNRGGTLTVQLQPAARTLDQVELLRLTLTARGRPKSSRLEDVLAWLDLGREWVVRGFDDLTTHDMHSLWERKY